ncbi:hypothetical protein F511_31426 [Dorcoceras hygrometricum]|uniref:Uncharacterized protein n=1 Tax=Dorcoceras hygrometricum TaxID=472368 RepID=A0A2Z7CGR1_9LAMI|nr:hypothetical protein F511_31426 [Dorcoceras hygrometricum]
MRDGSYPHASSFKVYGSYPLVLKPSILQRAYTARHIIQAKPIAVTKLNIRTLTSELYLAHAVCHNESPTNADPPPAKPIQQFLKDYNSETYQLGATTPPALDLPFYHHESSNQSFKLSPIAKQRSTKSNDVAGVTVATEHVTRYSLLNN